MRIPIDRGSRQPLYRQIAAQLRAGILSGAIAAGSRLPATRRLAADLGVNRLTIESAYAELRADGLIAGRIGSGTRVLPRLPFPAPPARREPASWPLWQQELRPGLPRPGGRLPEEVAAGARAGREGETIDFGFGSGDPRLFPVDDFRRLLHAVLKRDGIQALGYGEHQGHAPLREAIARVLASQGLPAGVDDVIVTSGSQQAIALVAQLLLGPGDVVLTESPTYGGALDLFRSLAVRVIGVPADARGLPVEDLEPVLQTHHPKLIYTIPDFHNPTGACLDGDRRRLLLELADRYNVPLLEDDFVGDLRYEGRALPALKALDAGGRVIYVSTFSKMLMPGLRVGFLVADGPVRARLVERKRVNDLATSNPLQRALEAYVTVGRYETHLRRSCRRYRRRRDAMTGAIRRCLPAGVRFDVPRGGLFLWLRLPDGMDSGRLLAAARPLGVSFAPGARFFPDPADGAPYLRLNFAAWQEEKIAEGIRRLGEAFRQAERRPARTTTPATGTGSSRRSVSGRSSNRDRRSALSRPSRGAADTGRTSRDRTR